MHKFCLSKQMTKVRNFLSLIILFEMFVLGAKHSLVHSQMPLAFDKLKSLGENTTFHSLINGDTFVFSFFEAIEIAEESEETQSDDYKYQSSYHSQSFENVVYSSTNEKYYHALKKIFAQGCSLYILYHNLKIYPI